MNGLFVEEILKKLVEEHLEYSSVVKSQDYLILTSFHAILLRGDTLTRSQGILLLKLLTQYKDWALQQGFDYSAYLTDPRWKSQFRSLDLTKKISVEVDDRGILWTVLKFPYRLKKNFEDEIEEHLTVVSKWDSENKQRKMLFYESNLLGLHEFAIKYNFELDETFLQSLSMTEEILNQQDHITPMSRIENNQVILVNAPDDSKQWWDENKNNNVSRDLLLAKSMGYCLDKKPETMIEKIAASDTNMFWQESNEEFFKLAKTVDGKVCLLLDRADKSSEWLKTITKEAENSGFLPNEIKICFRKEKENDRGFNQWIKDSGYGGPVEEGKILIFSHKPAKWIFKNPNDIKIIATNNYYPHTDPISRDWINSHPCVIYIGGIKPSKAKEQKIVQL
jgi:hypothetical protein